MAIASETLQNLEEPFSCSAETIGDDVVVTIRGELDLATRDQAEETMREAEDAALRAVIVDLRGLDFLGSTGLSMIIASAGRATARGLVMELVPSDGVRRLLAMTGVDHHLTVREEPPAA